MASTPRIQAFGKEFAAQYPARTILCRRLRHDVTAAPPRLESGLGRYCLAVWRLHPLLSVSYWRFSPDFLLLGGIGVSIGGVRCHKFERPAFGRHADGGAFAEFLQNGHRPLGVNRAGVVLRELL